MRRDLITDLFEKEEGYWWNLSKREMVLSLARDRRTTKPGTMGLGVDIGCGAGFTTKAFESNWHMVGIDLFGDFLQFCRQRGLRRLCQVDMTQFSLPFKEGSFDLALALDVIEHVEDDMHALTECHRILKTGGLLIVTVPAFMALWSPWDEALGHKRRYTALSLARVAQSAGLSVKRLTYMFFFIFPVAVFIRGVKRFFCKDALSYPSDFIRIPTALNSLLILIGRLEQWAIAKVNLNLPFGLSVISVMIKK